MREIRRKATESLFIEGQIELILLFYHHFLKGGATYLKIFDQLWFEVNEPRKG